ncbi:MAG: hypothetical protein J2P34_12400 [Actinobacteria bacterium]|nr:hypothetical protein [Actinomycetota bacterium]
MVLLGAYSALLVLALVVGATLAWLVAGRALRQPRHFSSQGLDAQAALRRHPAGRARWLDQDSPQGAGTDRVARPVGPDDDQEFIDHLERQIRGGTDPGPGT